MFLITARPETARSVTEQMLSDIGIKYDGLFMKPLDKLNVCSCIYKKEIRQWIEVVTGLRIFLNIGDQLTDISGGYSIGIWELPKTYHSVCKC
jgi:hypothetical protein